MPSHPPRPRFVASAISHALAGLLGGVVTVALGLGQASRADDAVDAKDERVGARPPAACEQQSARPTERGRQPVVAPNEADGSPPREAAEPGGRAWLLELQKAEAELALAELGGMPIRWSEVEDVPTGLRPEQFEDTVARVAADLGLAEPEVDCAEFPCVVMAPDGWNDEQFAKLRDVVRVSLGVEDAKIFGFDAGAARIFGVYSETNATPELLGRIWFRTRAFQREASRAADVEG